MRFYELYAGMSALSWRLHGTDPPVKYKGGKRGYARAILAALAVDPSAEIVLVEADSYVADALRVLWTPEEREHAAALFRAWAEDEAAQRARWTAYRDEAHADGWASLDWRERGARWLWMRCRTVAMRSPPLCARGDWCRLHYPNGRKHWALDAPAIRASALPPNARATVIRGRAEDITPHAGAVVYMDPPYDGTSGYSTGTAAYDAAVGMAETWSAAGSLAAISSSIPLRMDARTLIYEGQRGRAMHGTPEHLSIWPPVTRRHRPPR